MKVLGAAIAGAAIVTVDTMGAVAGIAIVGADVYIFGSIVNPAYGVPVGVAP